MPSTARSGRSPTRAACTSHPAVSPDGTMVACSAIDDSTRVPAEHEVGVIDLRRRRTPLDQRRPRPDVLRRRPCAQAPVWVRRRRLLAVAEDRGEAHLYGLHVDGRTARVGSRRADLDPGFDAAGGTIATTQRDGRSTAASCGSTDGDGPTRHALSPDRLGWEQFTVPCTDGIRRDRRVDHATRRLRRDARPTPSCSTSTAARSPSTARRSSTRPRCRPRPASWW